MKIRDMMQKDVATCTPESTAAEAATRMWERDCGILPVVDVGYGKLLGIVTDRDLAMAARTQDVPFTEIRVEQAMQPASYRCHPTDDIHQVHELMREHQIHRVPIIDEDAVVVGIVSLTDLARWAEKRAERHDMAALANVGRTLSRICQRKIPAVS